jgi:plastocyanin
VPLAVASLDSSQRELETTDGAEFFCCFASNRRGATPAAMTVTRCIPLTAGRVRLLSRRVLLRWLTVPAAFAVACARRPTREQQVVNLFIETDGDLIAFKPDTLMVLRGTRVRLTFHHAAKFVSARHDWMLTYPDKLERLSQELLENNGEYATGDPRIIAVTPLADKGGTVTTEFTAPPPGDYPFLCSTHSEDMRGILHVTE